MIYVVGNEQNYHFQVLSILLDRLGFKWGKELVHFSYGMVELRVTEVPFVKYRTIELFCFQRTEFYRKSSEFKASEKLSLYLRAIENGQKIA